MDWGALLNATIYQFRDLFGSQNFAHFSAYLWGLILCEGRSTVTNLYLAGRAHGSYWALLKFLGRGRWQEQALVETLLKILFGYVPDRVYVYDHTHAIKTGKQQYGLHFFRNHRYRKRNTNQSKFHWGHEFAAIGLLALSAGACWLFPLWVTLIEPGPGGALRAFEQVLVILPPGLIIFDRGFNNRKYFKRLLKKRHQLLCRARSNMVFYALPTAAEQPKRGRKKLYGHRVHVRHWRYATVMIPALEKTVEVASQLVRSRCCPVPVRLVVIRTRPKPSKPYRYFLVYTTDLSLTVETIVTYYKHRWGFETSVHDSKESFGFDQYQVRSKTAIERHVQLSFVAASLIQLLVLPAFVTQHGPSLPALNVALAQMQIHWYDPRHWTKGLIVRYLRWNSRLNAFLQSMVENDTCKKCETAQYDKAA